MKAIAKLCLLAVVPAASVVTEAETRNPAVQRMLAKQGFKDAGELLERLESIEDKVEVEDKQFVKRAARTALGLRHMVKLVKELNLPNTTKFLRRIENEERNQLDFIRVVMPAPHEARPAGLPAAEAPPPPPAPLAAAEQQVDREQWLRDMRDAALRAEGAMTAAEQLAGTEVPSAPVNVAEPAPVAAVAEQVEFPTLAPIGTLPPFSTLPPMEMPTLPPTEAAEASPPPPAPFAVAEQQVAREHWLRDMRDVAAHAEGLMTAAEQGEGAEVPPPPMAPVGLRSALDDHVFAVQKVARETWVREMRAVAERAVAADRGDSVEVPAAPVAAPEPAPVAAVAEQVEVPSAPIAASEPALAVAVAEQVEDHDSQVKAFTERLSQRETLYVQDRHIKREIDSARSQLSKLLRGSDMADKVGTLLSKAEVDIESATDAAKKDVMVMAGKLRSMDPKAARAHAAELARHASRLRREKKA